MECLRNMTEGVFANGFVVSFHVGKQGFFVGEMPVALEMIVDAGIRILQ